MITRKVNALINEISNKIIPEIKKNNNASCLYMLHITGANVNIDIRRIM